MKKQTECCYVCKYETKKACTGCNGIYYCGEDCQREDWKRHKLFCTGYNMVIPVSKPPLNMATFENDKIAIVFFHSTNSETIKNKIIIRQEVTAGTYKLKPPLHKWTVGSERIVENGKIKQFQCVRAEINDIKTKKLLASFCATPGHTIVPGVYKQHIVLSKTKNQYQTKVTKGCKTDKQHSTLGICFNEKLTDLKPNKNYLLTLKLCSKDTFICNGETFNAFKSTGVNEIVLGKLKIAYVKI